MFKRHGTFPSKILRFIVVSLIITTFSISSILPPAAAQSLLNLPLPGSMVTPSTGYYPISLAGIKINPQNPLQFDFIIDTGDSDLFDESIREDANRVIKYFLASLTTPEEDLWVNLSPYEQDRIIAPQFGLTQMGRDLLAQDYLLKQITASLISPEKELGRKFWSRVYKKAYEQFGTTDIPVDTFNKVWIVPEKAVVYEHTDIAFVIERKLKVLLEEDYLARKNTETNSTEYDSQLTQDIIRQIIIPELEHEVNEGKNFATLRQIYNSLILAAWFKQNLKNSFLGKVYAEQNKITGINVDDPQIKQKIYEQYLEAFKIGVYDYIREEYDPNTQQIIPRKYFSGGASMSVLSGDNAMLTTVTGSENALRVAARGKFVNARTNLNPEGGGPVYTDAAMTSDMDENIAQKWAVLKDQLSADSTPIQDSITIRFDENGQAKPYSGVTTGTWFDSPSQQAVRQHLRHIYDQFRQKLEEAGLLDHFILLDPSSYHVTIYDLITTKEIADRQKNKNPTTKQWPDHWNKAGPLEATDNLPLEVRGEIEENFFESMRTAFTDLSKIPNLQTTATTAIPGYSIFIPVVPQSPEDEHALHFIRNKIAESTGIKVDNPFFGHITLAYQVRDLTKDQYQKYFSILESLQNIPSYDIQLDSLEYREFRDLTSYTTIGKLNLSADAAMFSIDDAETFYKENFPEIYAVFSQTNVLFRNLIDLLLEADTLSNDRNNVIITAISKFGAGQTFIKNDDNKRNYLRAASEFFTFIDSNSKEAQSFIRAFAKHRAQKHLEYIRNNPQQQIPINPIEHSGYIEIGPGINFARQLTALQENINYHLYDASFYVTEYLQELIRLLELSNITVEYKAFKDIPVETARNIGILHFRNSIQYIPDAENKLYNLAKNMNDGSIIIEFHGRKNVRTVAHNNLGSIVNRLIAEGWHFDFLIADNVSQPNDQLILSRNTPDDSTVPVSWETYLNMADAAILSEALEQIVAPENDPTLQQITLDQTESFDYDFLETLSFFLQILIKNKILVENIDSRLLYLDADDDPEGEFSFFVNSSEDINVFEGPVEELAEKYVDLFQTWDKLDPERVVLAGLFMIIEGDIDVNDDLIPVFGEEALFESVEFESGEIIITEPEIERLRNLNFPIVLEYIDPKTGESKAIMGNAADILQILMESSNLLLVSDPDNPGPFIQISLGDDQNADGIDPKITVSDQAMFARKKFVGKYKITKTLSSNYLGEFVYLAVDPDNSKKVVIKQYTNPSQNKRASLKREAQLLEDLESPYFPGLISFNETRSELIMEYFEGETLKESGSIIQKLNFQQRLMLVLDLIDAIEILHKKGFTHRDISTTNIILTPNGRIKVIDLGSALPSDQDYPPEMQIGKPLHSPTIGTTPLFMAPEVITSKQPSIQMDIFSVGIIAYLLLYNNKDKFRFTKKNARELPLDEILNILSKALAASPEERYQTLPEMAQDIFRTFPEASRYFDFNPDTQFDPAMVSTESSEKPDIEELLKINTNIDWASVRERISSLHNNKKLTKKDVALFAGISYVQYRNFLNFNRPVEKLKRSTLERLSNYFKVSIDYLLSGDSIEFAELTTPESEVLKKLSENIEHIRNAYGLTKEEIARIIEVSPHNYQMKISDPEAGGFSIEALYRLKLRLGISITDLYTKLYKKEIEPKKDALVYGESEITELPDEISKEVIVKIGKNIQTLIQKSPKTQNQILSDMNISRATLHRLLSGESKNIQPYVLIKVAKYFNVSVLYLITGKHSNLKSLNYPENIEISNKTIQENLNIAFRHTGLSRKDFSEKMGITESHLSNILNGKVNILLNNLIRFSKTSKTPIDLLLSQESEINAYFYDKTEIIQHISRLYSPDNHFYLKKIIPNALLDISSLSRGTTHPHLPLPTGQKWIDTSKTKDGRTNLGIGKNLSRIEYYIHKENASDVSGFIAIGYKRDEDGTESLSGKSYWRWDGERFQKDETMEDEQIDLLLESTENDLRRKVVIAQLKELVKADILFDDEMNFIDEWLLEGASDAELAEFLGPGNGVVATKQSVLEILKIHGLYSEDLEELTPWNFTLDTTEPSDKAMVVKGGDRYILEITEEIKREYQDYFLQAQQVYDPLNQNPVKAQLPEHLEVVFTDDMRVHLKSRYHPGVIFKIPRLDVNVAEPIDPAEQESMGQIVENPRIGYSMVHVGEFALVKVHGIAPFRYYGDVLIQQEVAPVENLEDVQELLDQILKISYLQRYKGATAIHDFVGLIDGSPVITDFDLIQFIQPVDAATLANDLIYKPAQKFQSRGNLTLKDRSFPNFDGGGINDIFDSDKTIIRVRKKAGYSPYTPSKMNIIRKLQELGLIPQWRSYGFTQNDPQEGHFFVEVDKIIGKTIQSYTSRTNNQHIDLTIELLRILIQNKIYVKDFKPENLMIGHPVSNASGEDSIFLVDFDQVESWETKTEQELFARYYKQFFEYGSGEYWDWSKIDPDSRIMSFLKENMKSDAAMSTDEIVLQESKERITEVRYIGAGYDIETAIDVTRLFPNTTSIDLIDPNYSDISEIGDIAETRAVLQDSYEISEREERRFTIRPKESDDKELEITFQPNVFSDYMPEQTKPSVYIAKVVGAGGVETFKPAFYEHLLKSMQIGDFFFVANSPIIKEILDNPESGLQKVENSLFDLKDPRLLDLGKRSIFPGQSSATAITIVGDAWLIYQKVRPSNWEAIKGSDPAMASPRSFTWRELANLGYSFEATFADLEGNAISLELVADYKKPYSMMIQIYHEINGLISDDTMFIVYPRERIIDAYKFYPDFTFHESADGRPGAGRALFKEIFNQPHFSGFKIVGTPSEKLEKSLDKVHGYKIVKRKQIGDKVFDELIEEIEQKARLEEFTTEENLRIKIKEASIIIYLPEKADTAMRNPRENDIQQILEELSLLETEAETTVTSIVFDRGSKNPETYFVYNPADESLWMHLHIEAGKNKSVYNGLLLKLHVDQNGNFTHFSEISVDSSEKLGLDEENPFYSFEMLVEQYGFSQDVAQNINAATEKFITKEWANLKPLLEKGFLLRRYVGSNDDIWEYSPEIQSPNAKDLFEKARQNFDAAMVSNFMDNTGKEIIYSEIPRITNVKVYDVSGLPPRWVQKATYRLAKLTGITRLQSYLAGQYARHISYIKALMDALKSIQKKPIKTVYYPGIGRDLRTAIDISNADTIVGVDDYSLSKKEIVYNFEIEIVSMSGKNLTVQEIGTLGKGGKLIFTFEYNGKRRELIYYKEDAEKFTPDVLEETKNGYDLFFGAGASLDSQKHVRNSLSKLNPDGLFIANTNLQQTLTNLKDSLPNDESITELATTFSQAGHPEFFIWKRNSDLAMISTDRHLDELSRLFDAINFDWTGLDPTQTTIASNANKLLILEKAIMSSVFDNSIFIPEILELFIELTQNSKAKKAAILELIQRENLGQINFKTSVGKKIQSSQIELQSVLKKGKEFSTNSNGLLHPTHWNVFADNIVILIEESSTDELETILNEILQFKIIRALFWDIKTFKLILNNRRQHLIGDYKSRPTAIFLSSTDDQQNFYLMKDKQYITQLDQLGYFILFSDINSFESEAKEIITDFTKRQPFSLLWISAHGEPESMGFQDSLSVNSEVFENLSRSSKIRGTENAPIVLNSCSTGGCSQTAQNMAQAFQKAFPNARILAPIEDISRITLTRDENQGMQLQFWGANFSESKKGNPVATYKFNDEPSAVGGIDLNPNDFTIERTGEGINFDLPADMKYLESMPINGFTPIIFEIVPITNLPLLLGLSTEGDSPQFGTVPTPDPIASDQPSVKPLANRIAKYILPEA